MILVEQARRFDEEDRIRRDRGGEAIPRDDAFLEALELGMPPAGGVALGFDRLIMLLLGKERLDEVLPFA